LSGRLPWAHNANTSYNCLSNGSFTPQFLCMGNTTKDFLPGMNYWLHLGQGTTFSNYSMMIGNCEGVGVILTPMSPTSNFVILMRMWHKQGSLHWDNADALCFSRIPVRPELQGIHARVEVKFPRKRQSLELLYTRTFSPIALEVVSSHPYSLRQIQKNSLEGVG
jgi:hypothetical protein